MEFLRILSGVLLSMLPMCLLGLTKEEEDAAAAAAAEAAKKGDKWFSGFSEEVKNHPTTIRYNSSEDAMKGHIELEKKIGLKGVILPTDKSSEQEIGEFYKAVGRPEKFEEYKLSDISKLHKGVQDSSTPETQKAFKEMAFKAGLTSKQVMELHASYMQSQSDNLTNYDAEAANEMKASEASLRSKWGNGYEGKVALAKKLVTTFAGDKAADFLQDGEGNNPVLVEMFANIAAKLSEDAFAGKGSGNFGMTAEEAKRKIAEIKADPKHPHNDDSHLEHDDAIKYVTGLYKIIYPS